MIEMKSEDDEKNLPSNTSILAGPKIKTQLDSLLTDIAECAADDEGQKKSL